MVIVYAPNGYGEGKRVFFDDLLATIHESKLTYNCENVLLGGDLNLVFRKDEVKTRSFPNAEWRLANEVKIMFDLENLCDGWDIASSRVFT